MFGGISMNVDIEAFVNNYNKENDIYQIQSNEVERYLMCIEEKCAYTKTFFSRTAPVRLMDIFTMPRLSCQIGGSEQIIYPNQMSDLTSISNKGLVVGNAGSGKSTLLKYLLLRVLEQGKQIPIYFELRNIIVRKEKNLIDNLFEEIKENGCLICKETFMYGLETGRFVLFLDAIDEVNSRSNLINELNSLSNIEPLNIYVTSRPVAVNRKELMKYSFFNVLPFEQDQICSFLDKIYYSDKNFYLEMKNKLICHIKNNSELINSPLMVSIIASVFELYGVVEQPNSLVEAMINTLWIRHDATKNGYKRETAFSVDVMLSACKTISFHTMLREKYVFEEEFIVTRIQKSMYVDVKAIIRDLVTVGILIVNSVKGRKIFSFVHREVQVYFASKYIMDCSDDMYKNIIELLIQNKNQVELLDSVYNTDKSRFALKVVYPASLKLEALINNKIERYQQCFNFFIEYIDIILESQKDSGIYNINFKVQWNQEHRDLLDIFLYFANKKLISKKSVKAHEIDKRVYDLMVKNQSNCESYNTENIRLDKKGFSNATIKSYLRSTIDVGQLILYISNLKSEFDEVDKNKKLMLKELFYEV